MRKTTNNISDNWGNQRVVEFFAWLPVYVDSFYEDKQGNTIRQREKRWLEKVKIRQMFKAYGLGRYGYGWVNQEFLN